MPVAIKVVAHFTNAAIVNVYAIVTRLERDPDKIPAIEIDRLTQDGPAANKKWKETINRHN